MNEKQSLKEYLSQILESLKSIDPQMVLVFGSYSKENINEDSDLDLMIVLNQNDVPKSYDEKIELKLKIRKLIREINRKVAIDLLVYTVPEYEEFIKSNSSFSKEILETGHILYEKAS